MRSFLLFSFLFGFFISVALAGVQGNMDFTKVYPNAKGAVTFFHQKHAERFPDDCGYCHSALETFGGQVNELFAHKVCKVCHESHHGPTDCKMCHLGEKQTKK